MKKFSTLFLILIFCGPVWAGWIIAESNSDPNSRWNAELYTSNWLTSLATFSDIDATGQWLELDLASAIDCNKIRIWTAEEDGNHTEAYDVNVVMQIYNTATSHWESFYSGYLLWFTPGGGIYNNVLISPTKNISKLRILWKAKNPSDAYENISMYIYEVNFFRVSSTGPKQGILLKKS